VSDDNPLGKYGLNQGVYTTMSYQDGWKLDPNGLPPEVSPYGYQGTPMAIDIAVLQEKYGVNQTYHKGNDVYVLPDENGVGTYFSCIWDAGGRDAIVSGSASPTTIDLRAATLKVEPGGGGYISYVDRVFGGYTIAHDVVIENAVGGSGDDYLSGNGKKNRLKGGEGDDQLFGRRADDRLEGGSGDDVLAGGRGDDRLFAGSNKGVMTGGSGKDAFIFDTSPATGSMIAVTDFTTGKDMIKMSVDAFDALAKGKLAKAAFAIGAVADDALEHILYDPGSGVLRYDPDGAGGADAIQFALLSPGLALSHKDFVVIA
jgi:Ca2+-binding RTX toxin-like protein